MTGFLDGLAIDLWNLGAWALWVTAIVQVCRTPAATFIHRWRTKIARITLIALLTGTIAGLYLPVGAAIVLVALHRSRRQEPPALSLAAPRGPRAPR